MDQQSTPRMLLIGTTILMVLFVLGTFVLNKTDAPSRIQVMTQNEPTIGDLKSKVHVVVFEEPKCAACKTFTTQVYPELKKAYIDTNKISLSVIPISFLHNSMPAAEALICVYHQDSTNPNDKLFFSYLETMYKNQPPENEDWATSDKLIELAQQTSPEINLEKLKSCIANDAYTTQVMHDTAYASQLMGTLNTPKIYVNGIKADSATFDSISKLIDDALGGKQTVTEAKEAKEAPPKPNAAPATPTISN